ncbi:MAG: putative DNA binding domain-containing protein [Candidatus Poribacteria bacterium]|nr:putative DNA binding domain-containing protein [Candidatus Poribacteria bacterium]MDE0469577.1 putative DNA binding domain-containing protein [Candidatus Poribacteria bacterium]
MENLVRRKIILCLLDCAPKPANEIAAEIDESLTSIEDQLTALVSENICEKVNQNGSSQYNVKKDIEIFAQLTKEFLSEKEENREQIEQFITSEYYFTRIDSGLVDHVLQRFHLDSIHQTDEEKESTRRILLASPSALFFALHSETKQFRESWEHRNQLNPSDEDRKRIIEIDRSLFMTPLVKMLTDDLKDFTYRSLHDKLEIRMTKTSIQVSLATPNEQYVEAIGGGITAFCRLDEDLQESLRPGQWLTFVNPMDFSDYGLALLNLGEFQNALDSFDKALNGVPDPNQKAMVLNNKGWAFLRLRQYQKAIECFEEGITLDPEGEISVLHENKQIAEEYLVQATDADNLTEPTQIRFVQDQPVPFEETRFYEFKEIKGRNPANRITKDSDEYAVAFLNSEGGRIFWGVTDSDRTTVGVTLNDQKRDEVRRIVSEKLGSIDPPVSVEDWQLELHQVYNLHGEAIEDLWVVELLIPSLQKRDVVYTNSGELFVKTEGGKQKLLGAQVTEFIRSRFQNEAETS